MIRDVSNKLVTSPRNRNFMHFSLSSVVQNNSCKADMLCFNEYFRELAIKKKRNNSKTGA